MVVQCKISTFFSELFKMLRGEVLKSYSASGKLFWRGFRLVV